MKTSGFKKVLPHVVAIILFLIVSVLYNSPALQGKVLGQHDVVGWKGAAQNAFDYKEKNGHFPLWNTNIFSGMPNYQIAMGGKHFLPDLNPVMGLWLPKPANFFFIACVCFYILCMAMGLHPVTGILGALAYAFSTYNPVIISAGHETKMMAIAYMPLLLAGLWLVFTKRYWIGLSVATLGAMFQLSANHPQVSYYFFIIAAAVTLSYLFIWIKNKAYPHMATAFALCAIAAAVGLGCYSLAYLTTAEYTPYTMRGGKSVEIKGDTITTTHTKGLDYNYAFQYSMSTVEPLVMLMPDAFGGSSAVTTSENSNVVKKLAANGIPEATGVQLATSLPAYWGGMTAPGEGTSGAPYAGAIIVLLAIIGFVIIRHPVKWALLVVTLLSALMSMGKYLPGFNTFLFDTLPLYNKFRAPSMALMIAQLTLPVMAVITIQYLFFAKNAGENLSTQFKKILYTLGGVIVVLGIIYIGQSYSSALDEQILTAQQLDQDGNGTINRAVVAGLKADRQAMFGGQIVRTLLFVLLLLGLLYATLKKWLKPVVAVALLAGISFIDLWIVDKKYLSTEQFVEKDALQTESFAKTPVNEQILKDPDPHFRVFDVSRGFTDNHASYYHRSALGYHPAKLRIYQDVIERYFATSPNEQVLNALDIKYIINQNTQGKVEAIQNPGAYGAVWFVKGLKGVADNAAELQAIGTTSLKDTAVLLQTELAKLGAFSLDTTARIALTQYSNDTITYHAQAATPQFAVFSEVYYPAGWNAYIDGQKTDISKTNYFMRGLKVPAGTHSIKMIFEPATYKRGVTISYISSWLLVLLVLGGFFMQWKTGCKKCNEDTLSAY